MTRFQISFISQILVLKLTVRLGNCWLDLMFFDLFLPSTLGQFLGTIHHHMSRHSGWIKCLCQSISSFWFWRHMPYTSKVPIRHKYLWRCVPSIIFCWCEEHIRVYCEIKSVVSQLLLLREIPDTERVYITPGLLLCRYFGCIFGRFQANYPSPC